MGLFDYYKQFEGLSEEEVNRDLRKRARQRRAAELARIDPIDCSRTTWHEYPPSEIVDAITYHARRGLQRYAEGREAALRELLGQRHAVPTSRIVIGEGASGHPPAGDPRAAGARRRAGDPVAVLPALSAARPRRPRDAGAGSRPRPGAAAGGGHPADADGDPRRAQRPDRRAAARPGDPRAARPAARAGRARARRGAPRVRDGRARRRHAAPDRRVAAADRGAVVQQDLGTRRPALGLRGRPRRERVAAGGPRAPPRRRRPLARGDAPPRCGPRRRSSRPGPRPTPANATA